MCNTLTHQNTIMEFLSIQTDRQKRAAARLSIANEGLSDYIKDLFSSFTDSRLSENEAKAMVYTYFNESSAKTGISRLLNETVNNEKWREKNLNDRPIQINTCFGVIDGNPTNNFPALVKCFGEMYGLAANVMLKYKSNTELRTRVFTEMRKAKGDDMLEAYEEILEKYRGQLETTTPDGHKWLKSGGRNIPAVGTTSKNSWPVGEDGFYNYPVDQVLTMLSGPTVSDYETFKKGTPFKLYVTLQGKNAEFALTSDGKVTVSAVDKV